MTEIIPAIDIIEGKAVRLSQGDYSLRRTYGGDPSEWARRFADCGAGRLHIVDLDGAKASSPKNLRTLETIASLGIVKIEWGGGIKGGEALESVWNAGADWAIIGSVAATDQLLMERWLGQWAERIILGADVRNGRVAVKGWLEDGGTGLEDLIERFAAAGLKRTIVTDISRDGMLEGPSFPLYTALKERFPSVELVVSGGVSGVGDILRAGELGMDGIIVGKALYEGKISMEELSSCLQRG